MEDVVELRQNDIIVRFSEETIISADQLVKELWTHEVSKNVKVIFWREETKVETIVTLAEQPQSPGY
jgi:S1-C subfamily serine protease